MTKHQIEIAELLYDQGITYAKIAEMLEVSELAVKRACNKIERERKHTLEQYPICKECGKRIIYERKTRPRLFCDAKCKQTWWNKRIATSNRTSDEVKICPTCGKQFITPNSIPRKYCSKICFQRRNMANK